MPTDSFKCFISEWSLTIFLARCGLIRLLPPRFPVSYRVCTPYTYAGFLTDSAIIRELILGDLLRDHRQQQPEDKHIRTVGDIERPVQVDGEVSRRLCTRKSSIYLIGFVTNTSHKDGLHVCTEINGFLRHKCIQDHMYLSSSGASFFFFSSA